MAVDITSFTPAQRKAFNDANALGTGVKTIDNSTPTPPSSAITPISVAGLQTPQTSLNFQTPNPTLPYNVAGLSTELAPTAQETEGSDLTKRIRDLNAGLLGESAYRTSKEAEAGLPEQLKAQTDLSSRLKALQNEALAIPIQLQQEATGRGITAGGLRPIETASLRNNAIQALGVSSLLEASRGNITLAQDLVDRAVAQKYDPIKEEIAVNKANLDLILNDPLTTLADKNRANAQKALQDAKAATVAKQEQDAKDIRNLALTAQKYSAPMDVVQKIQNAKTFDEAQLLAGQYLVDPKAKYELENAKLDNVLKQAQITKTQKETSLLGEPTAAETKASVAAMKEATASLQSSYDQIDLISGLKSSDGLRSRVGTSIYSRISPNSITGAIGGLIKGITTLGVGTAADALAGVTGSGQNFSGGVHKLQQTLTLKNLQDAKANGATFGALSDAELNLLASSASKLADWEIKDGKGNGTGIWNIDQNSFNSELDNISRLTARAIQKSEGTVLSGDEKSQLDNLFNPQGVLNPAGYF